MSETIRGFKVYDDLIPEGYKPRDAKHITIEQNSRNILKSFTIIPEGIVMLTLTGYNTTPFTNIEYPKSLRMIKIIGRERYRILQVSDINLPEYLHTLFLLNCEFIFDVKLPSNLHTLYLSGVHHCADFKLPPSLRILSSRSPHDNLDNLPPELEILITGYKKLPITNLPTTLKKIVLPYALDHANMISNIKVPYGCEFMITRYIDI
ncbi:MAG: hypothetical protein Gaeavirus1_31 [Gaeavirus sp.]|uniref:FNIP repeat-containing protein n=1 Tax=Gaeavirus sp. TaxID=2487767 RepID=A0A3G5A051_9VIRU|nr:MAG: hypothetical protein Gaeavirus1_31 [Gaeavirus sp.]